MLQVKVFCATMSKDRETLGDKVSEWLRTENVQPEDITDKQVLQSSDNAFHCISIVLWYNKK